LNKPRLLFVDDEASIRLTLSAILGLEGFQVTVASTVAEALALITAERYDVLVSDLNIGQPGDGFTVVSAMRRVQPNAVTLILTGYPAFEAALRAIREQVDDFFTKPTNVHDLIAAIRDRLKRRNSPSAPSCIKRLPEIIGASKETIVSEWLRDVEQVPGIAAIPLSRNERIDHLPALVDALIEPRQSLHWKADPHLLQAASMHGVLRRKQGYSVPLMLEEARILNAVVSDHARRNLLTVEISFLIPDLVEVADRTHYSAQQAVRGYLESPE
jgi:ActR/RegA family two-component response regulator